MKKILIGLVMLASLASVACGGGPCGACDDVAACEGSTVDADACKDQCEAGRDAASELGCGSEFDAYLDCASSGDVCDAASAPDCASEQQAFLDCGIAAAGG